MGTAQLDLPPLKGFYRTPFGFYVADHRAPMGMTWPETAEWTYRDGAPLIPNSHWSRVATLTDDDLARIENPDVEDETRRAQSLMIGYPGQFVNLMTVGNRILIEPLGFGVKVLDERLQTGYIMVYDHDVSRIVLGEPQEKYGAAKLVVDETAREGEVRFAIRFSEWYGHGGQLIDDKRYSVLLTGDTCYSFPTIGGLGFRPEGNQAYSKLR
ncbi:MAG: hypothetical protein HYY37_00140 [Candidatus Aenigmarchaeota archaeon]|nr:hypothetical protein [Candidatus Aenigmarchaeota archaeon]